MFYVFDLFYRLLLLFFFNINILSHVPIQNRKMVKKLCLAWMCHYLPEPFDIDFLLSFCVAYTYAVFLRQTKKTYYENNNFFFVSFVFFNTSL